ALEVRAVAVLEGAVEHLVALEVGDLEVLEPVPDLLETVELGVRALADLRHLALGRVADLAARVGLGTLGLELGQVGLELLGAGVDVVVAGVRDLLLLQVDLVLEVGEVLLATLLVDRGDHVRREVDDLLQVLRGEVQQVAEARGHALEEPDVRDRRGELDVAHALTAHLRARHLDAAALADDALEAHALVLAAVALPVPGGAEDLLAEEAVLLGLEGAVVDGLGLLHLTVRPRTDVAGRGQADTRLVEAGDVEQVVLLPSPAGTGRGRTRRQKDGWCGGRRRERGDPLPPARDQISSTLDAALGRRDRSMPSSSAARYTSSSDSRISMDTPSLESTSTFRHSDCISLRRTLKDSGMPESGMFSPLTIASYTFTRPGTSSDLIVRSSCSV